MREEHRFALMLARLVELVERSPDLSDDHKVALDSIGELTSKRSWSLQLRGTQLSVEGVPIPPEVPLVPVLVGKMRLHDLGEIHIGFDAAELEIMRLVQILSAPRSERGSAAEVTSQLQQGQARRIWVLGTEEFQAARASRQMRISDALEASGVVAAEEVEIPALDIIASSDTASQRMETLEPRVEQFKPEPVVERPARQSAVVRTLGTRMAALGAVEPGEKLSRGLNELTDQIVRAARDDKKEAVVEALAIAVKQEADASSEEGRRAYGVALRRMLGPEVLRPLADLLMDPLYIGDVMLIFKRAGQTATQLLLDLLVAARTFAERRAFLAALRDMGAGTQNVIAMLSHHQWYVVRNVADLVGELKIEEAVPALGSAAGHADARVRSSVGIALARIGTRATARFLRSLVRDADVQVRQTVVKEIGGAGLGALVGTLINQADEEVDDGLRCEHYRALGRIGTTEAVQALAKVAQTRGGLFGQRNTVVRKAAVEGLALAGSDAAVDLLKELARDRDREVRDAAQRGLNEIAGAGAD